MRVPRTSFVHRSDMTVNERLTLVETELDRAIERESRRAREICSLDEMLDEILDEMRDITELKLCTGPIRKRVIALVLRTEKDIEAIFGGREYERRRRRDDD